MLATKKPALPPKAVPVSPNVTDPAMRNPRGPAEMLLNNEMGESTNDREVIFNNSTKTKEEEESGSGSEKAGETNTLLLIVFALIVIALVAVIVWMLMKQPLDKKEEEDIKRLVQPGAHPRNGMPPNPNQAQMAAMQNQQMAMQQHMDRVNSEMATSRRVEQPRHKPAASFAEVATLGNKNAEAAQAAQSTSEFSNDKPHPTIIRPKNSDEVDDIGAQAAELLKKKIKKVSFETDDGVLQPAEATPAGDMSSTDRMLLDKVFEDDDE